MKGFTGKTIEVDLATGEIGFYHIEEELYRKFIGEPAWLPRSTTTGCRPRCSATIRKTCSS